MTTPNPFAGVIAGPARGGTMEQFKGRLVLITPVSTMKKRSSFPTDDGSGLVDAVVCEFVVLDGENYGEKFDRITVMSGSMTPQLLPYIGKNLKVVGKITKEKFDRGQGWVINDPTDDDIAVATKYLTESAVTAPAAPKDPFAAK
jgi:hypothetical protein